MLKINNIGVSRNEYVKREALKMLVFGPLFSVVYIVLSFISMSQWPPFFYLTAPLLIILMIFFFIVAPIKMLRRHNRTIAEISVEDDVVIFKTFPALWMNPKLVTTKLDVLTISTIKFYWYGKKKKEGFKVKSKHNGEYYIVIEYFDVSEKNIKDLFKCH